MATTHKVYETVSTYKGRPLKMRHTVTDVDEDYSDAEALERIKRSVLPEGATNTTIRNVSAEDPQGPLAKVEKLSPPAPEAKSDARPDAAE